MSNVIIPHTWVALEYPTAANFNANNTEIATKFNSYAFQLDGSKAMAGDITFTDALYDIGKSGATRPRDLFTSRNITPGGNLLLGGATVVTSAQAGEAVIGNGRNLRFQNLAGTDTVPVLGYKTVILSAADQDIALGNEIWGFAVDETGTGATVTVNYLHGVVPNLLTNQGTLIGTGVPGAAEIQIKERTGGSGLAVRAGATRVGDTFSFVYLTGGR